MFGIGAGLVITPIQQATYKAIADADGVKRITATEHDSRTGQLALFFDWRLIQAWHPAAEHVGHPAGARGRRRDRHEDAGVLSSGDR